MNSKLFSRTRIQRTKSHQCHPAMPPTPAATGATGRLSTTEPAESIHHTQAMLHFISNRPTVEPSLLSWARRNLHFLVSKFPLFRQSTWHIPCLGSNHQFVFFPWATRRTFSCRRRIGRTWFDQALKKSNNPRNDTGLCPSFSVLVHVTTIHTMRRPLRDIPRVLRCVQYLETI